MLGMLIAGGLIACLVGAVIAGLIYRLAEGRDSRDVPPLEAQPLHYLLDVKIRSGVSLPQD